jgi:integrase
MANLKSSTYSGQIKNAFHRLESFSVGRHGKDSHKTHSDGLAKKREEFLNSYKSFAENNNFVDKLNKTMTPDNMNRYLSQRLEGLSLKTKIDYIRGWSSMVQGLQEANITIKVDRSYFDIKVKEIKTSDPKPTIKTERAIKNVNTIIAKLYQKNYTSGVLAEIQYKLGVRVAEAFKILNDKERYLVRNMVVDLRGKANRAYLPKKISKSLLAKIEIVKKIPHENTYRNHISKVTGGKYTPHSFRYTHALNTFKQGVKNNTPYKQIMKKITENLGHSRISMSQFYLKRA